MRRWAMNCTIWRSTSTSAPFSASSVNAIVVAVVIVDHSSDYRLLGSHLNLIREPTVATPFRDAAARRAASRFGLRPTRLAAPKDLHHFLGHQRNPTARELEHLESGTDLRWYRGKR